MDFVLPQFKCGYCEAAFVREDSRNRHQKACEKNPESKRPEKRKRAKRGTRVNKLSLSAQPPVPTEGMSSYLQLTEEDAPHLPRLDPESPQVFRWELFCRYPGCGITTRYGQPSALRIHYKVKHNLEFEVFRTSMGPVAREQHEACKTWLAQYAQLGQENVGPAPPMPITP